MTEEVRNLFALTRDMLDVTNRQQTTRTLLHRLANAQAMMDTLREKLSQQLVREEQG